jgi:hypothetical protein
MGDLIIIKWKDNADNWQNFDISDIMAMTIRHAVNLFSGEVPVIIKEGAQYLVNTADLLDSYRKKGSKVMMISQVDSKRFDNLLSHAGFVS